MTYMEAEYAMKENWFDKEVIKTECKVKPTGKLPKSNKPFRSDNNVTFYFIPINRARHEQIS